MSEAPSQDLAKGSVRSACVNVESSVNRMVRPNDRRCAPTTRPDDSNRHNADAAREHRGAPTGEIYGGMALGFADDEAENTSR